MAASSPLDCIRREAIVLTGDASGFDAIVRQIGDARIVLLGEATHGTHEFYAYRAEISKRLICEKGFDAIAVEADWPDALCVSRTVQHLEDGLTGKTGNPAAHALRGFERFPRWMWRNTDVLAFVEWLHAYNATVGSQDASVGFFGLDLYSLRSSMDSVVRYLDKTAPELANEARRRYGCFDHLADDPQSYGYAVMSGRRESCEQETVRQLVAMVSEAGKMLKTDGHRSTDELFYAQQNARVVRDAERYYRTMFRGRDESWNIRDTHMADTLEALCEHIARRKGRPARVVVWAHNSHLGDARATEASERGELNLGQLTRERFGVADTFLLGFTTHAGTVAAASDWDSPPQLKKVRPSRSDSVERLFHDTGFGDILLPMRSRPKLASALTEPLLERAIGVIYRPETERYSHYFHVRLAEQFDAVVHLDETRAVEPLDLPAVWRHEELPETFPSGF